MHWFLITYLLVLLFVAFRPDRFRHTGRLRAAWLAYAAAPISHFFFALIRAGNFGDAKDLALVEIWSDGITWLLLGLSIYNLAGVVAPSAWGSRFDPVTAPAPPPPPAESGPGRPTA